jgi:hypothetical protein
LSAFAIAKRKPSDKARALAVTWGAGGLVAALIRAVWSDLRDDEDDELLDDKHWDPARLTLATIAGPLYGLPIIGAELEAGTYRLTGHYRPDGTFLTNATDAALALKHLPDTLTGQRELDKVLRDLETILSGAALFNDTAAAYSSLSHLARDLYRLSQNATN